MAYFFRLVIILEVLSLRFFLPPSTHAQHKVNLPAHLAAPSAAVEDVLLGLGYCEGPAVDSLGNVFFTEHIRPHRLWKVTPWGASSIYRTDANFGNGLDFDRQGRLVMAVRGALERQNANGTWATITPMDRRNAIAGSNDLSIGPDGSIYFTNFDGGTVFLLRPNGQLMEWKGFNVPNGIEWVPESNHIYLAVNGDNKLARYSLGSNGQLENRMDLADVRNPDGLTLDERGNIYQVSYDDHAVHVYDSTGRDLGNIVIDARNLSNCVFGGPEGKTLYMTGQDGLRRIELLVAGRKKYSGSVGLKGGLVRKMGPRSFESAIGGPILLRRQSGIRLLVPSPVSGRMLQYDLMGKGKSSVGRLYFTTDTFLNTDPPSGQDNRTK